ncbi:hypothetical protein [Nonomuraea guangzhouensis]|uniref:Uncharacterized protein n=1 Tax=Nonomuraea guangzhouensis TaxID=1291555 RepID=A0ABW4G8Q2_9ACTN|nr:hypothetical protein [Nonomuraea guangzhouensis]
MQTVVWAPAGMSPVAGCAVADATVKIPSPMTNSRRRPKRSPSAAPNISRTAK